MSNSTKNNKQLILQFYKIHRTILEHKIIYIGLKIQQSHSYKKLQQNIIIKIIYFIESYFFSTSNKNVRICIGFKVMVFVSFTSDTLSLEPWDCHFSRFNLSFSQLAAKDNSWILFTLKRVNKSCKNKLILNKILPSHLYCEVKHR